MSSTSVPGTNVAPITFPGIVSGIDYNAIIQKLTSLTLEPTNALNAQMATLNSANLELININNLITSVQNSLENLSNPLLFDAFDAVSSDTSVLTAQSLPSVAVSPGTYVIEDAQLATATIVGSNVSAGYSELATIASGTYVGQNAYTTAPLAYSYAAVTPSNGTGSEGTITIDGVQVQYNVNGQSLQTIFTNINNAVATVDPSFHIGFEAGTDITQITANQPITLGSSSDQGNLLQVLKLDEAQVNNSGPTSSVTGTSGVGGLNEIAPLDTGTDANLTTPIGTGTFTINGVKINVDAAGDNIASILTKINASNAGVTASYNEATNQITLVNNNTGPQSIVLGAFGDSSNFLSAVGLTTASGATTTVGQQAIIAVQNASGVITTVYSGSNQITDAIPGVQINLTANVTTPVTLTVAKDNSGLVGAINSFISAYNAAIGEINSATQAPVVAPVQPGQLAAGGASSSIGGGVLFGNANVQSLRYQLTNMVSGFLGSSSDGGYNSLSQIGIELDDSFSTLTTGNNGQQNGGTSSASSGSSSNSVVQNTQYEGTDGQLQQLNTGALLSALAANPSAVQDLLNGGLGLTSQLGGFLTSVTGTPTLLNSGLVGVLQKTSLLQGYENSNTDAIANLQAQVTQISDNANSQANLLRSEFVSSETSISLLQSEQQELAAALGFTVSSSSASSSHS